MPKKEPETKPAATVIIDNGQQFREQEIAIKDLRGRNAELTDDVRNSKEQLKTSLRMVEDQMKVIHELKKRVEILDAKMNKLDKGK